MRYVKFMGRDYNGQYWAVVYTTLEPVIFSHITAIALSESLPFPPAPE
jgi:hypothetical protein